MTYYIACFVILAVFCRLAGAAEWQGGNRSEIQQGDAMRYRIANSHSGVLSLDFAANSKLLAAASFGSVHIVDLEGHRKLTRLTDWGPNGGGVSFSPDGRFLAATAGNADLQMPCVLVWDLKQHSPYSVLPIGFYTSSRDVLFSANGRYLATAAGQWGEGLRISADLEKLRLGGIEVWDVADLKKFPYRDMKKKYEMDRLEEIAQKKNFHVRGDLSRAPHGIRCLDVSRDGRLIASFVRLRKSRKERWRTSIKVWSLPSGKLVNRIDIPEAERYTMAMSPDAKTIACVTSKIKVGDAPDKRQFTVSVWEVASGKLRNQFSTKKITPYQVMFSPSGQYVAAAMSDGTGRMWSLGSDAVAQWQAHRGKAFCIDFSADGKLVATGGEDKTVLVRAVTDVLKD